MGGGWGMVSERLRGQAQQKKMAIASHGMDGFCPPLPRSAWLQTMRAEGGRAQRALREDHANGRVPAEATAAEALGIRGIRSLVLKVRVQGRGTTKRDTSPRAIGLVPLRVPAQVVL